MSEDATELTAAGTDRLLAYVADLELEVDRLRGQGRYTEKHVSAGAGDPAAALAEVAAAARELAGVVRDLHDTTGYHPAHDQVVAVAVRPLAEQAFRWQQRLTGARGAGLRLELEADHVEWFPARLRHILDNLFANALRHRDPAGPGPTVALGLRPADSGYELRVSDDGPGPPPGEDRRVLELFYRAAPIRLAGLGAGVAVVKMLVEQSGGTMTAGPRDGRGTEFVLTLPRYDLLDYLD